MTASRRLIARFLGDPTGYRFVWDDLDMGFRGWVHAEIGSTARFVLVNLDQAYLVRAEPAALGRADGLSVSPSLQPEDFWS